GKLARLDDLAEKDRLVDLRAEKDLFTTCRIARSRVDLPLLRETVAFDERKCVEGSMHLRILNFLFNRFVQDALRFIEPPQQHVVVRRSLASESRTRTEPSGFLVLR